MKSPLSAISLIVKKWTKSILLKTIADGVIGTLQ